MDYYLLFTHLCFRKARKLLLVVGIQSEGILTIADWGFLISEIK